MYMKYVSFLLPPLEAALSIFNVSLFFGSETVFDKGLIKTEETAISTEMYPV